MKSKSNSKVKKQFNFVRMIVFILLAIFVFTMVYLFLWSLMNSVKASFDFSLDPLGFPPVIHLENFITTFGLYRVDGININNNIVSVGFIQMFWNSILYSVGCTVLQLGSKIITGYIFSYYDFKMKKFLYGLAMVCLVFPVIGSLASELEIMMAIGFYDNVFALMIMKCGFGGMDFLLFISIFNALSWDYAEAAQIDGASQVRIMFTIMIPMIKASILIFALQSFISFWNDYSVNIQYMPTRPVAAYGLYNLRNSTDPLMSSGGQPYQLCASLIFCLPNLILFAIFKKQLFQNLNFGGLKE